MKLTNILPTIIGFESISPKALNQKIKDSAVAVFDFNSQQTWMEHTILIRAALPKVTFRQTNHNCWYFIARTRCAGKHLMPLKEIPALDFMGITTQAVEKGMPYWVFTIGLMLTATT